MAGDMTAIPSLTVQKLIEKARNCSNLNSDQLKETLQLTGFSDPQTGLELSCYCVLFLIIKRVSLRSYASKIRILAVYKSICCNNQSTTFIL